MLSRSIQKSLYVLGLCLMLLYTPLAHGGGALNFNKSTGVPYRWNVQSPIPYQTDLGNLGLLNNAAATSLVDTVFQRWAGVSTAAVSFSRAGNIRNPSTGQPVDVNLSNFSTFLSPGSPLNQNVVVFDVNGEIFNILFGANSGVLGFAGPTWISGGTIIEGQVFLNGAFLDGNFSNGEVSQAEFEAVIFHEVGHFNNLDHAQINGFKRISGAAPATSVETMFPALVTDEQRFPAKDDEVALSTLYPRPSFVSTTGAISGTIFNPTLAGNNPFTGANVIARNIANPFDDAVSQVSGATLVPAGVYTLNGLTPGAKYTVEIEPIDPSFTQGSSVGPLDPPIRLPGPAEFYNGPNEASSNPPDNPGDSQAITVSAGMTVTGINILINTGVVRPTPTPNPALTPTPTATPTPPPGSTPTPAPTPTATRTPSPGSTPTPTPTATSAPPVVPPSPVSWGIPGDTSAPGDYDGDHKADITVWRASEGNWYLLLSSSGSPFIQSWGVLGDKIVPGDYNGDGWTDLAVWRPSTGTWFIQNSFGSARMEKFGKPSDVPVPGDYDGDGVTDIAIFRPSQGGWGIKPSGGGALIKKQWGQNGDIPVPSDYDGDGKTDLAVWRPIEERWYLLLSGGGILLQSWGVLGDELVPADYDGDGRADMAVWRPQEGNWYILRSSGGFIVQTWGMEGDVPVPADYNGDGKVDIAVWRPSNGFWFILPSSPTFGAQR